MHGILWSQPEDTIIAKIHGKTGSTYNPHAKPAGVRRAGVDTGRGSAHVLGAREEYRPYYRPTKPSLIERSTVMFWVYCVVKGTQYVFLAAAVLADEAAPWITRIVNQLELARAYIDGYG